MFQTIIGNKNNSYLSIQDGLHLNEGVVTNLSSLTLSSSALELKLIIQRDYDSEFIEQNNGRYLYANEIEFPLTENSTKTHLLLLPSRSIQIIHNERLIYAKELGATEVLLKIFKYGENQNGQCFRVIISQTG